MNRAGGAHANRDGLLLVRLVSKNVGELTAAELLCALWNRHGSALSVDHAAEGDDTKKDGRTGWRRRRQLAAATHRAANDVGKSVRSASAADEDDAKVRHSRRHRRHIL